MVAPSLTLTRARLWTGQDAVPPEVDVRITDGRIDRIVPTGTEPVSEQVLDVAGRWVMPGLVDHHVHFTTWARQRARVDISHAHSAAQAAASVREVLVSHTHGHQDVTGLVIGRGFREALWPDRPTAQLLDEAARRAGQPHRPIALISHDLHCVWLNSAAAAMLALKAGVLREQAAFSAQLALDKASAHSEYTQALIAEAAAQANARGVTGIVDFEHADNPAVWAQRVEQGMTRLRVRASVYPEHLDAVLARSERTGKRLPDTRGLVSVGALKVFCDGALTTRTAWCYDPYPHTDSYGHAAYARGDLEPVLADARLQGFDVSVHAIGDRAVAQALDAFAATGARGTIEHAQLVSDGDLERFAALGISVSIQPEHALDDRDVADALWEGRTSRAYPYGQLVRAGARVLMGSDAPVVALDPWVGVSAAVFRQRDGRTAWEAAGALSVHQALAASWTMGSVAVGAVGDLVAVDADPRALDAHNLRTMLVAATVVAGTVVHCDM